MEEISRNLAFEIFRFLPQAIFICTVVSKTMQNKVCGDVDYMQYFLEDTQAQPSVRDMTYVKCARFLAQLL